MTIRGMTYPEPTPVLPDGRPVAELEELRVLDLVRDLGEACLSDVARAVWPEASPEVAAEKAQRTVTQLLEAKPLTQRKDASGGSSLSLSQRGMARLGWHNIGAWEGYDLRSESKMKAIEREIATSYLIGRHALGHGAFGVHALSNGLSPIDRGELLERFGTAPDGLVLVPGPERGHEANVSAADWIEVVIRGRSRAEYERIFMIARSGSWLNRDENIRVDRVLLVLDTQLPTEKTIVQMLRQHLSESPTKGGPPLPLVLVRCRIGFPLVWKGCEEVDCTQVLRERDSNSMSRDLDAGSTL